jgi:hypothetical protein
LHRARALRSGLIGHARDAKPFVRRARIGHAG